MNSLHRLLVILPVLAAPLAAGPQTDPGKPTEAPEALERATRLRDESVVDWKAKRFVAAAEKLRAAEAIYAGLEGDHSGDRATCLRAITWNLADAGVTDGAQASFADLVDLVAADSQHVGEVASAFGALSTLADRTRADSREDAEAILESARAVATAAGHPKVAAQALHDLAAFAAAAEDWKAMQKRYEKAIAEREALDDAEGIAWSSSSLAHHLMGIGREADALEHLHRALVEVSAARAVAPQIALAANLERAAQWAAEAELDRKQVGVLWSMAEVAAAGSAPEALGADRLVRVAMEAELARKGRRGAVAAAERAMDVALPGRPAEIAADVTLRAARVALASGKAKPALRWLERLECGDGPCGPHLEARRQALLAEAFAVAGDGKRFGAPALRAVAAFEELGERKGHVGALERLVEAAREVRAAELGKLEAALEKLRMSGEPGGLGGSAYSLGGLDEKLAELGPHDTLYELTVEDGKVVARSPLSDVASRWDFTWRPRVVTLNGTSIGSFGGYVTVRSSNAGSSRGAEGSGPTASLDGLGSYFPIPAAGALQITKNGAVRYAD